MENTNNKQDKASDKKLLEKGLPVDKLSPLVEVTRVFQAPIDRV